MEAINNCPCGTGPSDDHHAKQVQTYRDFERAGPSDYFVWCDNCGKEGPFRRSREAAIKSWNDIHPNLPQTSR